MARQWIARPLAQADIEAAATWYEQQQTGLGLRFIDAVDHVLRRIRESPLQFPSIATEIRRALLHTFPYAIYFRLTEERIVVLAVLHLHRDPRIWRERTQPSRR
jgi:plasmid stabilization system protein ParE